MNSILHSGLEIFDSDLFQLILTLFFLQGTLRNGNYSPYSNGHSPHTTNNGHNTFNSSGLSESLGDISLVHSPPVTPEVKSSQLHPKTLVERARMNVGWLDSSLSIMEQGIHEFDTLLLRFKYYTFYDLNPKLDAVRINMIFEQAKWLILNEQLECTEEEMLLFAALQVLKMPFYPPLKLLYDLIYGCK